MCQVKILGAKPALCVTLRGKQGGVLGSDTPRRTGSDCTSLSKDGTEPPGTKGFHNLDQLVQNNHTCSGEPHSPPHSTPLVETYSSKENLSLRLQFSDTWTQHTISGRIFSTLGKKGIKQSFLKLHQPAQLPSSHSLPYKAFPALYHIPYSTKCFLSYFTLLKGFRSWILQCDL